MRIVLADDHALFRDSLKSLLETRGHDVVALASNGREAVTLVERHRPDMVLMDLNMPEMDGLEATQRLTAAELGAKVVMLTISDEDQDLFEAIKAGAEGYLLKDIESERFFALIEGVARGEPALTPALAKKLLAELRTPKGESAAVKDPDALTAREEDVLSAMVRGITTNRDLASHLGVSQNTVKFHVRNILDKLHLHNRAQAVSYALRNRLVDSD
ncbi:MAG: response regulator transcription factor [Acidobacteriota bacterium]